MKRATVLAATMLAVSPSFAQTLDDIVAAEAALAAARQLVVQADEDLIKVWEATPLTFRNAVFTVGDPEGFGRYTPRADPSFRAGDLLITYAEVVGYGWRENKDGSYTVEFDIDYVVKDSEGKIIAADDEFAHIEIPAKSRNRNFNLTLELANSGAEPGDYTLEYSVRDEHEGETGLLALPFSIVE